MHRFISPNANLQSKYLEISDKNEIHHLTNVLRLKKESHVTIFNGQGEEAIAEIENLNSKIITLTIISSVKKSQKNRVSLTLACAIPKKAKFETIIEKCTELGVDRIIPVITDRTEFRVSHDRQDNKVKRYQTVAVNAAKQCQRNFLPQIDVPTKLSQVLKGLTPSDAAFIPCLTGKRENLLTAFALTPLQTNAIFFIGPEGDFTPKELTDALEAGCVAVSLGPTVLKVDTAAMCVIACAKLLLTDTP